MLAPEQFNLDVIHGYFQGRQSIFKDLSGQLVVFGTIIRRWCVQPDSSKGTEKRHLPRSQ